MDSFLKVRCRLLLLPHELRVDYLNDFSKMALESCVLLQFDVDISACIEQVHFEIQIFIHLDDFMGDEGKDQRELILDFNIE